MVNAASMLSPQLQPVPMVNSDMAKEIISALLHAQPSPQLNTQMVNQPQGSQVPGLPPVGGHYWRLEPLPSADGASSSSRLGTRQPGKWVIAEIPWQGSYLVHLCISFRNPIWDAFILIYLFKIFGAHCFGILNAFKLLVELYRLFRQWQYTLAKNRQKRLTVRPTTNFFGLPNEILCLIMSFNPDTKSDWYLVPRISNRPKRHYGPIPYGNVCLATRYRVCLACGLLDTQETLNFRAPKGVWGFEAEHCCAIRCRPLREHLDRQYRARKELIERCDWELQRLEQHAYETLYVIRCHGWACQNGMQETALRTRVRIGKRRERNEVEEEERRGRDLI